MTNQQTIVITAAILASAVDFKSSDNFILDSVQSPDVADNLARAALSLWDAVDSVLNERPFNKES